ncbi:MAG: hypothetical protein WBC21_02460 [Minisyncoccales bacterium]
MIILKKFLVKVIVLLTVIMTSVLLFPPIHFSGAAALTNIYDRLSDVEENKDTGVSHYIVFTPPSAHTEDGSAGGNAVIIKLEFPDAHDGQWCATAGDDLSATAITEDSATGLPGSELVARCVAGSGASSYDTIYICADDGSSLTGSTKYGVKIADGATAKLGTATTAADNIKVTVATGLDTSYTTATASTCSAVDTSIDSGSYALSILSDSTVAVSATVDAMLTFSIDDLDIGFGTFSATTERFATADGTGSTSAASNGEPTEITITTNAPNGAIVSARSKGNGTGVEGNGSAGLYKSSSPTKLIAAVASSSVSSGSEGYALYVKNVTDITGTLNIDEGFDDDTNTDLAISTTNQTIASASAVVDATADVALNAAISSTTAAGTYSDVITLTGTGKY